MCFLRLIKAASLPLLVFLIAVPGRSDAQSVKGLVDSQNYVFQVQVIQPLRGPARNATAIYTFRVTKNRIISDLPYFGRAYVAPMNPTQNVLQFTLNHFDYKMTRGKKEGWNVVIRPRDKGSIQEIQLDISSAGYTSLQVVSTDRDPISFTGIITAPNSR